MISDVNISRLDELVGDFDTPFFNYLLYSYGLSVEDCESVIDELKRDIRDNKIMPSNLVSALDGYFKSRVADIEKMEKIDYLGRLIQRDSDFYVRYLERYGLSDSEIEVVYNRVKSRILEDNITDFEIKRNLEYYFENTVRQVRYNDDLDRIIGRNYDTLFIRRVKRQYPVLLNRDIAEIIAHIREEIIEARDFPGGIRREFEKQCMLKSEAKKADARVRLNVLVEGKGDSFAKLVRSKNLTRDEGERIVSEIHEDINMGLIQPERVDAMFLTKRFNEYVENEGK